MKPLEAISFVLLWPYIVNAYCDKSGFYLEESGDKCMPCQEENVAYFGNNLEVKRENL